MNVAALPVLSLAVLLAWVLWWLIWDWRRDVRQAKAAGQAAQAAIADMGRHRVPASEERTDPKFAEALLMLPVPEDPPKRPRGIPVQALLDRAERQGVALRLNWQPEDEQRTKTGDHTWAAGDFPTAVLPVIQGEEP